MEILEPITRWDGIESAGGPMIFIPGGAMPSWDGIRDPAPRAIETRFRFGDCNSAATDYDRACEVDGYLGVLAVGNHEALVIGDDPGTMVIIPSKSGRSLLIAKWICGPNVSTVLSSLSALQLATFPKAEVKWNLTASPQRLFDSAALGNEVDRYLFAELPPARYDVSTLEFRPTDDIHLTLHWIRQGRDSPQRS